MKMTMMTIALLLSFTIHGQNIDLSQEGNNNTATLNQSGDNSLNVTQQGFQAGVTVNQDGSGNFVNVYQGPNTFYDNGSGVLINQSNNTNSGIDVGMDARNDAVDILQFSTSDSSINLGITLDPIITGENSFSIIQEFTDSGSNILVAGEGTRNVWSVYQSGSSVQLELFNTSHGSNPSDNFVNVVQNGFNTFGRLHLEGSGNSISMNQNASNSDIDIGLFTFDSTFPGAVVGPSDNNVIDLTQSGDSNHLGFAAISAFGDPISSGNSVTFTQDGQFNSVNGGTAGSNNTFNLDQIGDNNSVDLGGGGNSNNMQVNQSGQFNGMNLGQNGDSNTMIVMQSASNSFINLQQGGNQNTVTINVN